MGSSPGCLHTHKNSQLWCGKACFANFFCSSQIISSPQWCTSKPQPKRWFFRCIGIAFSPRCRRRLGRLLSFWRSGIAAVKALSTKTPVMILKRANLRATTSCWPFFFCSMPSHHFMLHHWPTLTRIQISWMHPWLLPAYLQTDFWPSGTKKKE